MHQLKVKRMKMRQSKKETIKSGRLACSISIPIKTGEQADKKVEKTMGIQGRA